MTTDDAGGEGDSALGPGRDVQRENRHFLALQEQCVRAGLVDAIAESVPRLRTMAEDTKLSRRTRQRAEYLLQTLARHVIPAPAKAVVDARSQHVHVHPIVGIDRGAYQAALADPARRAAAAALLEASAGTPAVIDVELQNEPKCNPPTNGRVANGSA